MFYPAVSKALSLTLSNDCEKNCEKIYYYDRAGRRKGLKRQRRTWPQIERRKPNRTQKTVSSQTRRPLSTITQITKKIKNANEQQV